MKKFVNFFYLIKYVIIYKEGKTMINTLPKKIQNIVLNLNYTIDEIGRSQDQVIIFNNTYVLKISQNKEMLLREKQANDWLNGKIPCAKSIAFEEHNNKYYYLRTCIKGSNLISKRYLDNPKLLIDILAEAVNALKSIKDCPFNSTDNQGNDFIHGDLCLPNIFADENDKFAGFIDLANSGLGDKWYDYAWMLWSLNYNLKTTQYHKVILDKINEQYDEEKYKTYIPKEYL